MRTKRLTKKGGSYSGAALKDADVGANYAIGSYAPARHHMWDEFYTRGIMGLAWGEIGDLTAYAPRKIRRHRCSDVSRNGTQKNGISRPVAVANEMKPERCRFS